MINSSLCSRPDNPFTVAAGVRRAFWPSTRVSSCRECTRCATHGSPPCATKSPHHPGAPPRRHPHRLHSLPRLNGLTHLPMSGCRPSTTIMCTSCWGSRRKGSHIGLKICHMAWSSWC
ncbi:hypothetical protein Krad_2222 [Kineococcus radiotolerans SRS30216 = ATCC BAA-149]|uniref:Uncharacterized protein n=1 Tax=Kineococcus radiotolerans (strain ATCC BAA-149 / DSM 14245 / SRS30216) TaxID=266940 RepID=A6WA64_KINRD|nr:hypothetical protein Krad_2222 [Kineococcus radiotolerans SRS30216 = ATCC BAA-149]